MQPSVVVGAGVVPIPPVAAAGIEGLAIQPRTPAISIISRPPPAESDCHEAIVEVIVIVDEVVVIMTMPIVSAPSSMGAIPARAAMPRSARKSRANHWATETATAKIPTSKVGSTTEVASTHATSDVASAPKASTTEAVGRVRLLDRGRGKKQAARKGGYCKRCMSSHDTSPGHPSADLVESLFKEEDGVASVTRVKRSGYPI